MPAKKKAPVTKRGPATRRKPRAAIKTDGSLNFTSLVDSIRQVHEQSAALVNRTVNTTLTVRNWVIGAYIREYEQNGADRAQYGANLLEKLSSSLQGCLNRCYTGRYLGLCRQLFDVYPGIRKSLISEFRLLPGPGTRQNIDTAKIRKSAISKSGETLFSNPIWRSVTAQSGEPAGGPKVRSVTEQSALNTIRRSVTAKSTTALNVAIRESLTPELGAPVEKLLTSLSFTHLAELIAIEDPLKRAFYEIECIRGNWSVRALKRQIATLYFERSGLSKNKEKLAAMVKKGVETAEPKLAIRDPYIFEFLGLRAKDAMAESDLEAALVENLREFLLELGHGFCLEAQQKSIVIGRTRGFVDLVFYHRILKCHVLVELKVDEFKHDHLGQLNTYVTWYRKHMMAAGDNPPVGLLLCTGKDHALVQYAIASMDNRLFVSKYAMELPSREELEKFLHARHLEMLGNG